MIKRHFLITALFLVCMPMVLWCQDYEVNFLGIPVVRVHIQQIPNEDPGLVTYEYAARTTPLFSAIYKVNNHYRVTMDTSMSRIVSYEKEISQKNFKQSFHTLYKPGKTIYSTGEERIAETNRHTMLSLLLSLTRESTPREFSTPLEIEGAYYSTRMIPREKNSNILEWEIILLPDGGSSVLASTDLFTSRLADPEAQRSVSVDISTGRIVSACFTLSPYTLTARILGDS
ncbi:MAG: hypothetical protein XD77_0666 [Marinimicrobia bacterium 46_47]|nr:MAG: hypothetical protein XD77_0666 [Marinimicrobia bacterium 46_47]KUK93415.1 MAG: hypothetical protein XE04_0243 [Marinimicrobia bacterium 46_43]